MGYFTVYKVLVCVCLYLCVCPSPFALPQINGIGEHLYAYLTEIKKYIT